MVTLTIDGKTVEVEEGSTILQAAEKLGIEIPTLCHHKALLPYGACRLCLVELVGPRKSWIQASCVYPAEEGLVVKTSTERVLRTRKIMIELLLARCPEVEVVQELARQMGVEETRFPKKNEDCILCGLCARVCQERMGVGAVNFANRGTEKKVGTPYDKHSSICMACGACEVVCPAHCVDLSEVTTRTPRPIPSEFDEGLSSRASIYIPFAQAVPHKPVIDKTTCIRLQTGACGACEAFCDAGAIRYDQEDTIEEIEVGTIIVATGFDLFDAGQIGRYGYGRLKNVVNALEFERLSHASGPTGGELLTSAGKRPEAVAILTAYAWPGNVRELRNAIERGVIASTGPVILPKDLPPRLRVAPSPFRTLSVPLGLTLGEAERKIILSTLEFCQGNRTKAARVLRIGRRTLQSKLKSYGL